MAMGMHRRLFGFLSLALALTIWSIGAATARDGGVLVLGGTGQLGSEIVKDLVEAGEKVTVLARPTSNRERLEGLDVSYVIGDMLVEPDMERILNDVDYRVVVDASNGPWGDEDFYSTSMEILSKHAAQSGVSQLILHGAIGASDSMQMVHLDQVFEGQRVALLDKTIAEEVLINSGAPYTIIRHLSLLGLEIRESGKAFLTTDRLAYGPVTRDGLARLTLECMDNSDCINTIQHGIDHDVDLGDGAARMREMYKRVIKEEFYVER